jgi:hypothetical protein
MLQKYLEAISREERRSHERKTPGQLEEERVNKFAPAAAEAPGRRSKEDMPRFQKAPVSRNTTDGEARSMPSLHNPGVISEGETGEHLSPPSAADISHESTSNASVSPWQIELELSNQSEADITHRGQPTIRPLSKTLSSNGTSRTESLPSTPIDFDLAMEDDVLDPGISAFEYAIRPYTDTSTGQYLLEFLSPTQSFSSSDGSATASSTSLKALSTAPLAPQSPPRLELPPYLQANTLDAQIQVNTIRVALMRCAILACPRVEHHKQGKVVGQLKCFITLGKVAASVIPIAERLGHDALSRLCWYWRGRASAAVRDWDAAENALERAEELEDTNDGEIERGLDVSSLLGQVRKQRELETQKHAGQAQETAQGQIRFDEIMNDSGFGPPTGASREMENPWFSNTEPVWEPYRS